MEKSVLIGGSGGQGVLFLGKLIATVAMLKGKNVTWFPSYGAEVRGGTANCSVIISEESIGSPIITNPDILIIMNCPSLKKFIGRLKHKGLLFYDVSLINKDNCKIKDFDNLAKNFDIIEVKASEEAKKVGSIIYANMVLFGAFLYNTNIADIKDAEEALKIALLPRQHSKVTENLEAIKKGYNGKWFQFQESKD